MTTPDDHDHDAQPDTDDRPIPTMFRTDPLVGLRPSLLASAAGRVAGKAVRSPATLVKRGASLTAELAKVAVGSSDVEPERGDRRWSDDAWDDNPVYRRLGQGYLAVREEVYQLVEDADLDDKSEQRAEFALGIVLESLSPTNTLLNPEVLRTAVETRGSSLVQGVKNFAHDVRHNGGLPKMVDDTPFSVGENVAVTPGRVVLRNDVLELIQYDPATPEVHARPMLMVPPQINKFYILDIGPGKSMIEYLVDQGHQTFAVSWKNPTKKQREWDLDTYVDALLDAIEAMRDITGSDDINITGACAGGITTAALLGYLQAAERPLVHSATFLVTVLDMVAESAASPFMSERAVETALRRSQRKGVLKGSELARVFAWLRPNDLVCNYWVNNWLKGQNPPAFDILAWNADTTNLPAALHADFLSFTKTNPFINGGLYVLGLPIHLDRWDGDSYVVAGLTDHITPWESCYRTVDAIGGDSTFILSTSGHIQALVNPPGRRKASFRADGDTRLAAEGWKQTAERHDGSWWDHWAEWLVSRADNTVSAPAEVGSDAHAPSDLAPGRYVHNL